MSVLLPQNQCIALAFSSPKHLREDGVGIPDEKRRLSEHLLRAQLSCDA